MKIVSQHKKHDAVKVIYSPATLPVGQKHPYHYCSCLLTLRLNGMEEESISDHKLNQIKEKKRKRIQGTIISKIKKKSR